MARILGIAASLRNARWGVGNESLIEDLKRCPTEESLKKYLTEQSEFHLQNFVESGRAKGLPFLEIYKNLHEMTGDRGLSNSEVALAAGLWAAHHVGAEIEHVSLAEHFPPAGAGRRLDELKGRLLRADGILLSGPVYFGDRGSLAQDLVDVIRDDPKLRSALRDKVYAGIAVGAKRNGGQETTLIYQLLDAVSDGMLAVGNDSDTTSQYGGTGHAGDVGTMAKDQYGLWTSMGAGRRIAHVARMARLGRENGLRGKVRVLFWVLQDKDGKGLACAQELAQRYAPEMEATILDVAGRHVTRCIACDICPTHIGVDDEYRCIITGKRDSMSEFHEDLLHHDAIVPVVYSPRDRRGLQSAYQRFIERTRYLRRADYVFSDALSAPLVLEDLGALQNMHVRLVTSMIRHHTVVTQPMVLYLRDGRRLNEAETVESFGDFVRQARLLTAGRLRSFLEAQGPATTKYNPVGYILSTEKDKEDEKLKLRAEMVSRRHAQLAADAQARLAPAPVPGAAV